MRIILLSVLIIGLSSLAIQTHAGNAADDWYQEFKQEQRERERDTTNRFFRQAQEAQEQQEFFRMQRELLQSQQNQLQQELRRQQGREQLEELRTKPERKSYIP